MDRLFFVKVSGDKLLGVVGLLFDLDLLVVGIILHVGIVGVLKHGLCVERVLVVDSLLSIYVIILDISRADASP